VYSGTVPAYSGAEEYAKPYQLFFEVDGVDTPLTPARWPNAKLSDFSAFDHSVLGSGAGPLCYSSDNSDLPCHKTCVDGVCTQDKSTPAEPDEELTLIFRGQTSSHDEELLQTAGGPTTGAGDAGRIQDSHIDFTDTMVVLNFGAMGDQSTGCRVKSFNSSVGYLTYTLGDGFVSASSTASGHNGLPFFFEGHAKLIDSAEEWAYDAATGEYLLQTWAGTDGECVEPSTLKIRGKVVDVSLEMRTSNVLIQGVKFFGTTFKNDFSKLHLDHVSMDTPTFNKRSIGDGISISKTELNLGTKGSLKVTNSEVLYHDAPSLFDKVGDDFYFENNHVKGSCYAGCSTATISSLNTPKRSIFKSNTITHFNAFSAVSPSIGALIEGNYISHGSAKFDAAAIHIQGSFTDGTIVRNNWVFDSVIKCLRCDRINSVTASLEVNAMLENNVAMNTGPIFVKGDYMTLKNNVVINSVDATGKSGSLALMMVGYSPPAQADFAGWLMPVCPYSLPKKTGWGQPVENTHSVFEGNVADSFISVYPNCTGGENGNGFEVFPPGSSNNLAMGNCGPSIRVEKSDGSGRMQWQWKSGDCASGSIDNHWWLTEFKDAAGHDFRPNAGTESAKSGAGAYSATMTDAEYAAAKPGASGFGASNAAAHDPASYFW